LIVLINNARRSAAAPPLITLTNDQDKTALSQKDQNLLAERARTSPRSGRSAAPQPDKLVMVCTRTLGMGNPRFEHVLSQR